MKNIEVTTNVSTVNAAVTMELYEWDKKGFFTTEIHIVTLDAADGDPALPTAGNYTVSMQLVEDGDFHTVSDNSGVIAGTAAAGSAVGTSGDGRYILTQSAPKAIRVVSDGSVDVATHKRVTIKQIRGI